MMFLFIGFVSGAENNSIFISPSISLVNSGENILIEIRGDVSNETDIYSIQFDVEYDSSLLGFNSIVEGNILNSDGAVTIFDYSLGSGLVDNVIILRNVTSGNPNIGISDFEGVLATISFTGNSAGTAYVNINNVIWVNSTITNDSAVEVSGVVLDNGVITINTFSDGGSSGGSSSGGGGSSSGLGTTTTENNVTDNQSGLVDFEVNEDQNETEETGLNKENVNQENFPSLTGRIIENITSGKIFTSWIFYFIIGIIVIFVGVVFFRKYYNKKFKNKVLKKSWISN